MPPHPLALFSLKPLNDHAHEVVTHPCNKHLVSILPDGTPALDIGFNIVSHPHNTLATLGRNDTDIFVEGSSISRLQCSFEINLVSKVVMLYDRSNSRTTQVYGNNSTPFEPGRRRRVVVQEGLNTIFGMGGGQCDLVKFQIKWHLSPTDTVQANKSHEENTCIEDTPELSRTLEQDLSVISTRPDQPGQSKLRIRYLKMGDPLGSGTSGTVHKCIDTDSGKFMAVKIASRNAGVSQQDWGCNAQYGLKREVEILSYIKHLHIVDYITSHEGDSMSSVEMFMGLKEGDLESLVENSDVTSQTHLHPIARSLFPQMLAALDCLAFHNLIHRDVKPQNILYALQPNGKYQFQLCDFGLCANVAESVTQAGTEMYMAPEIYQGFLSTKSDVWSLFVTLLWTLDVGQFRQQNFPSTTATWEAVLHAALMVDPFSRISEMVEVNVDHRASAAQILVKHYGGEGLTTPLNQIPALSSNHTIDHQH